MSIQLNEWMSKAICKGMTHLFFAPSHTENIHKKRQREAQALAICRQCPVVSECRDRARAGSEIGIWGGETDVERWNAGYMRSNGAFKRSQLAFERRQRMLGRLPARDAVDNVLNAGKFDTAAALLEHDNADAVDGQSQARQY